MCENTIRHDVKSLHIYAVKRHHVMMLIGITNYIKLMHIQLVIILNLIILLSRISAVKTQHENLKER